MQEMKYPLLKKDRILKIEILENFRDFPRDMLEATNENMSDGIINGFTPKIDKDIITFSKGITKYNGKMYIMPKPTSINYSETEVDVMIKLNFYDELQDNDFVSQYFEIEIDSNMNILETQQELGRFKLKKGAYLRCDYQDLYDFTTEYNTINLLHVLYAGQGENTINNMLLKYFAREALNTRTGNQMDITFCMFCLNSMRIERQVIMNYIAYKLEEEIKPLTNIQIHDKLVKILGNIKRENSGLKRSRAAGMKIIVD